VNRRHQILIFFYVLLIFHSPAVSQESKKFDLFKDNIESILPPLEAIIDTAIARNPYVKFRDLQITVNEHKLKASRLEWTRDLGVQTDVRYGTFDNFATNIVAGQNPSLQSTTNTQTNYGFGAYIRVPFYDFLQRKNQIRQAKAEVAQATSYLQVQRSELRQLVIKQYNEVIIKHRLLKIKSRYIETAKINLVMADKQFLNGVITIAEYSSITEIVSRGEAEFESSKIDFQTAFMILEEIVGAKINLTDKLN
jgi:outer membrane protein TolC